MKNGGVLVGVLVAILIALALAVNFLLMPYLLMIVLRALGHDFSFLVCMAFWVVFSALLNKLRPKVINKSE
jgi:hypothetical protein